MFSEIGEELLSIYGQHEHQSLQRVETHIDILDEFGGLMRLREEFQNHFQEFAALSEKIRENSGGTRKEGERTRTHDLSIERDRSVQASNPEKKRL